MENTIKFPYNSDFILNQYYIYKDLKSVEIIAFDNAYRYMAILSSQAIFHIYDNLTKLNLGKIDFHDLIKNSSIYSQYEAPLKQFFEKDKHNLFDSVSFSKNLDFIAVASSKLATIFLIKTNLTTLFPEDAPAPELVGYIHVKAHTSKDCPLLVSMDPNSKYNCLISNNVLALTNFKSLLELKVPIEFNDKENEASSQKQKENSEENRIVQAAYLDRHCTKNKKTFIACNQDFVSVYEASFDIENKKHDNVHLLFNFAYNSPFKVHHIHLNYKNNYLAVKYHKKLAKIFHIDFAEKAITQKVEFEASEGRSWQDVIFNVYNDPQEEPEDWIILLEKNQFSSALSWYNLSNKTLKNHIIEGNVRVKKVYANIAWKSSIMGITDHGLLINLELKQPQPWVNYSYKFSFINENVEYVEKEDEFDQPAEEEKPATLTVKDFIEIPQSSLIREIKTKQAPFPEINLKAEEIEEKKEEEVVKEEPYVEMINEDEEKVEDKEPEQKEEDIEEKVEEIDMNKENPVQTNFNNNIIDEE